MKKILRITIYKVDDKINALTIERNPKSSIEKLAHHFTAATLNLIDADPVAAGNFLTIIISAAENVKEHYPDVAAAVRRMKIEFLKQKNADNET
jgi:hypothetical protein